MDEIEFVHLFEVKEEQIIDLMNNELVARQLPLLAKGFSAENCRAFLKAKRQLWDEHGFGPWAFLIKGEFAGWGGLQRDLSTTRKTVDVERFKTRIAQSFLIHGEICSNDIKLPACRIRAAKSFLRHFHPLEQI